MKRILAVLLTVLTLLSATTFGAFTAEAKGTAYTIKKLDKSEKYYYGSLNNYCKYPVFSGKSKGIKKVNKSFKKYANSFVKEGEPYSAELSYYYENYGNAPEFFNTANCKVTYNNGKIVSVKYKTKWYMGGIFNSSFYGVNYNLKTGKKLKIKSVLQKKYNPETKKGFKKLQLDIGVKLYEKYDETVAHNFFETYNTRKKLSNLKYYLNKNGDVVVCFITNDISSSAAGCLSVTMKSKYSK